MCLPLCRRWKCRRQVGKKCGWGFGRVRKAGNQPNQKKIRKNKFLQRRNKKKFCTWEENVSSGNLHWRQCLKGTMCNEENKAVNKQPCNSSALPPLLQPHSVDFVLLCELRLDQRDKKSGRRSNTGRKWQNRDGRKTWWLNPELWEGGKLHPKSDLWEWDTSKCSLSPLYVSILVTNARNWLGN